MTSGWRVCKRDGCRQLLEGDAKCPAVIHLDVANAKRATTIADHRAKSSSLARHASNTRCVFCREGGGCFLSACSRGPNGPCDCHKFNLGAKAPTIGIPLSVKRFT